jgi:subfamily B ATP-binding cassette protein HlyB/CyaB
MLGHCLPGEGRVLVDGADTRQLAVNELRRVFGVVPQETTLFSGSVHGNLQDANPDAGFDEIVAACRDAGIHDDIERLPQGYQTMVGERGVGLSGGQRQRIAIARALLRRARVLIFDEATSNLDAATADTFAHTVNRLKGRATIVFIAHAVPPALQVDFVYRFADAGGGVQGLA